MNHEAKHAAPYSEISVVRVTQLLKEHRDFTGSSDHERPPRVGDTGTIVSVYSTPGQIPAYDVECIVTDGEHAGWTIWLATFTHDELELLSPYDKDQRSE